MIDLIWTVVCVRAITDGESKNVSLIEVIEEVTVAGPAVGAGETRLAPLTLDVVSLWARHEDGVAAKGTGRLTVTGPNGEKFAESTFAVDVETALRMRSINRFNGMPVVGPGRVVFQVELKMGDDEWRTVARVPVHVVVREG